MKTRRDHLVELVAGLLMSPKQGTIRQHVEEAQELLAEIERACPEATAPFASVPVLPMDVQVAISDAVARTRIEERVAERERCAKIAEDEHHDAVAERIAAAIRRGGA